MRAAPLIALAAGCLVAAAVYPALTRMRDDAHVATPAAPVASGARITYPADKLPTIELGEGRREAIRSVLNVAAPLRFGTYVWNEERVPAGPVWIYVDLSRQLLSVFRGGHEIGSAVILYGASNKPSPTGAFPVLQKAADYHSRTYDAPMPFMLRLTADGVAIHGSNVRDGAATHGCIGVPTEFARRLYQHIALGDRVVIVRPAAAATASAPARLPVG